MGADTFLFQEYTIMTIFIFVFSLLIMFLIDFYGTDKFTLRFYTTISYIIGSFTSILCGYIGMKIAVKSNYRTTYLATKSLN